MTKIYNNSCSIKSNNEILRYKGYECEHVIYFWCYVLLYLQLCCPLGWRIGITPEVPRTNAGNYGYRAGTNTSVIFFPTTYQQETDNKKKRERKETNTLMQTKKRKLCSNFSSLNKTMGQTIALRKSFKSFQNKTTHQQIPQTNDRRLITRLINSKGGHKI